MKQLTHGYTIEIWSPLSKTTHELLNYFMAVGEQESALYSNVFKVDWKRFNLLAYAQVGRIAICRRNGKPVGVLLSRLERSVFDSQVKILTQDLLHAEKGSRAAKMLLDDFIDFGKAHANYIVTMTAEKSNLRARSLERLGFRKSEEHFWMET